AVCIEKREKQPALLRRFNPALTFLLHLDTFSTVLKTLDDRRSAALSPASRYVFNCVENTR
ncbi:MAG: hypothetical protein ACLFR1_13840, partial [Spirochaetia bacterium]